MTIVAATPNSIERGRTDSAMGNDCRVAESNPKGNRIGNRNGSTTANDLAIAGGIGMGERAVRIAFRSNANLEGVRASMGLAYFP